MKNIFIKYLLEGKKTSEPGLIQYEWHGSIHDQLATRWDDFVGCVRRLKTEGKFMQNILSRYADPRVFDAAMGTGCESLWLRSKGYDVIGNEVSAELRDLALQRAKKDNISLQTTQLDWRELSDHFHKAFNVVLLLGNSFSLLRGVRDRELAAQNIYDICRSSGRLIVDERNFRYILQERHSILQGKFRYTGSVIYCGKKIKGFPIGIDEDCVRFGYIDTITNQMIGALDMYPFKDGELIALFCRAGFAHVDVYSDLKLGYDPNADFYTYIFEA